MSKKIELVIQQTPKETTGIGRYVSELYKHLKDQVEIRMAFPRYLPFSDRFAIMRNFPLGVIDHQLGNIAHFTQIMGCAQMLWNPIHPSIATVHDLGVLISKADQALLNSLDRKILDLHYSGLTKVDLIITDSEFTRQGVITQLGIPEHRVIRIYPGIDHGKFQLLPNARNYLINQFPFLSHIASFPWILYVGSELPRKNIQTLLQVVALLINKISDVRLVKVGSSGSEKSRHESMRLVKKYELEDRVIFVNDVTDKELPYFYNAADVFVTATKLEGFGFPVLEALACGLPVVCTSVGSLPEIVGDAAMMHSPEDSDALAQSVCRIFENISLRERLIVTGKQQAKKFSWLKTIEGIEEVYKSVTV